MKRHTQHLVGVDRRCYSLKQALRRGYDEAVCSDVREFQVPRDCDSVFLIDAIEHMPKEDGLRLLETLRGQFVLLVTPSKFHTYTNIHRNSHVSLWTLRELQNMGFDVYLFRQGVVGWFCGDGILAVREPS